MAQYQYPQTTSYKYNCQIMGKKGGGGWKLGRKIWKVLVSNHCTQPSNFVEIEASMIWIFPPIFSNPTSHEQKKHQFTILIAHLGSKTSIFLKKNHKGISIPPWPWGWAFLEDVPKIRLVALQFPNWWGGEAEAQEFMWQPRQTDFPGGNTILNNVCACVHLFWGDMIAHMLGQNVPETAGDVKFSN